MLHKFFSCQSFKVFSMLMLTTGLTLGFGIEILKANSNFDFAIPLITFLISLGGFLFWILIQLVQNAGDFVVMKVAKHLINRATNIRANLLSESFSLAEGGKMDTIIRHAEIEKLEAIKDAISRRIDEKNNAG